MKMFFFIISVTIKHKVHLKSISGDQIKRQVISRASYHLFSLIVILKHLSIRHHLLIKTDGRTDWSIKATPTTSITDCAAFCAPFAHLCSQVKEREVNEVKFVDTNLVTEQRECVGACCEFRALTNKLPTAQLMNIELMNITLLFLYWNAIPLRFICFVLIFHIITSRDTC